MPVKTIDISGTIHPTVFAALLVAGTLAVGVHPAWAQIAPWGSPQAPVVGGIAGWVVAKQALFYRALAGMIRAAKSDGFALWGLMGMSFVYGIFHAAGPGDGKAVISSYLLANEETWRRGITLSFAAALMQSLTAVIIVGVAAVLLGATAKLMGDTVWIIEIVSYGLIMLLGARLLWVKGRGFFLRCMRSKPSRRTPKQKRTITAVAIMHPRPATTVSTAIKQPIMSKSPTFCRGAMCTARSLKSCQGQAVGRVACLRS